MSRALATPNDPSRTILGLPNGQRSTVRVRAWNDKGPSAWATTSVTAKEARPSVRIISPKNGAVVEGRQLTVVFEARPHPLLKANLRNLYVDLSDQTSARPRLRSDGLWTATLDVARLGTDGSEHVDVDVSDDYGRSATASVAVTVPRRMTTPTILEPTTDPAVWDGDTFTVRVDPGVDRLTGQAPEYVVLSIGLGFAYATSDNQWTVNFDRSVLPSSSQDRIPPLMVRSQGRGVLTSEYVEREIVLR